MTISFLNLEKKPVLTLTLLFKFLQDPPADQKFIRKYLQKHILTLYHSYSVDLQSLFTENTEGFKRSFFQKNYQSKKKGKPWKNYQKKQQKDKLKF